MVQFCYLKLYLGIETFPRRLLLTNGNDGNEMKLENVGTTFSSFTVLPAKINGKCSQCSLNGDEILFDIVSITLLEHFVYE